MGIETWITVGILLVVVGLAVLYVIRSKKKGQKCIGCTGGCCCDCQQKEE